MLTLKIDKEEQRRPSVAKMARIGAAKQVTWSPVEASDVDHCDNDVADASLLWYTKQELHGIRIANEILASYLDEDEEIELDQEESFRGLEFMTEQGAWERYQHHRDCRNRVLDEQGCQRGVDKLEYQSTAYPLVKRANHLHVPFDHERLAALCRDATASARRQARLRAKSDFKEIKADYETFLQATVASEEVSSEVLPETTRRIPPMPANFSKHDSRVNLIEKLEKEHKQRFKTYLTKRQERIEAATRAAMEWEEKRLARAAAIRAEADTSIENLKRIMDLSQQMTALVLAGRS